MGKMNKRFENIEHTEYPSLDIAYTLKELSTKGQILIGTPIDPETNKIILGLVPVSAPYSTKTRNCFEFIKEKIVAMYEEKYAEKKENVDPACFYVNSLPELEKILAREYPDGFNKLSYMNWGLNTEADTKRDFLNRFAPRISSNIINNYEITQDDLSRAFDDWFKTETLKSKRSIACKENSENGKNISSNNLKMRFDRCVALYKELQDKYPSLPAITGFGPEKKKTIKRELPKFIPLEVKRKMIRILESSAKDCPIPVLATCFILMGCRIGEACAVNPKYDLTFYDDYLTIKVLDQAYGDKVTGKMKNDYSKRIAVGIKVFRDIAMVCIEQLKSVEFPPAKPFIKKAELYEYFINLLKEAGIEQAFLDDLKSEYKQYEFDKEEGIFGLASHIARRDFVSTCINICGFSYDETMKMIGHKVNKKELSQLDMAIPTTQNQVAKRLENFVYDKDHTANSYYEPISLLAGTDVEFCDAVGFNFRCDSIFPVVARFNIKSLEINDFVEMTTGIEEKDIYIQLYNTETKNRTTKGNVICNGLIPELIPDKGDGE